MTDLCMYRLLAFPHSKLEAVLYASITLPPLLYRSRSCHGLRINPQPLSCLLFRACRRYHIWSKKHESSSLLLTPFALSSRLGRACQWGFAACACADFALIPTCRSDDIQVSLLAIVRENAFKPSRYTPIRLTFAVHESSI